MAKQISTGVTYAIPQIKVYGASLEMAKWYYLHYKKKVDVYKEETIYTKVKL